MHKNKIFVNKIKNKIGNNQSFTLIDNEELKEEKGIINKEEITNTNNLSIEEKINHLFQRNGYIFNVDVKIITNHKEYNTKVASKIGNHLITLDNDIININDIKDLIIKN